MQMFLRVIRAALFAMSLRHVTSRLVMNHVTCVLEGTNKGYVNVTHIGLS